MSRGISKQYTTAGEKALIDCKGAKRVAVKATFSGTSVDYDIEYVMSSVGDGNGTRHKHTDYTALTASMDNAVVFDAPIDAIGVDIDAISAGTLTLEVMKD